MNQPATQVAPAPAPKGEPSAASVPTRTGAARPSATSTRGTSTPAWLTRLRLGTAVLLVLAAVVATLASLVMWRATDAAAANTEQLLRAQDIKVGMLRADALATNAFLVGGLEPATQRAAYDAALADVNDTLVAAAQAQPADQAVLAQLSQAMADYAQSMTLARANNRQGFPVGAGYLSQASTELRRTGLPMVDALIEANDERARSDMTLTAWPWILLASTVAALGLLVAVNRLIAQRFHRRINPGLAAAAVAVVLGLGASTVIGFVQSAHSASLRSGSYATAVAASAARGAGNDAKANESLRLVARGSGATYEKKWQAADDVVVENRFDNQQWQDYASAHAEIVDLDNAGDWDGAVAAATTTGNGSASADFTAFDEQLRNDVQSVGEQTTSGLRGGLTLLLIGGGLTLVLTLAAAALAWNGITRRLQEYA
ncbi:MAG: hypothetical protein ACK5MP_00320 [Nostocoides sp.]